MEPLIAIVLALMGYAFVSGKMINQGNEALVERLGKYHRKLEPGLNFIVPLIDQIVMEDTTREQYIDIQPQNVITRDNIYLEVDAVLFWRIKDIVKSFYEIDDLEGSIRQLATTTLREVIAQNSVEETNVARADMSQAILDQLNQITEDWGVQIIRLEIQRITPPESVRKSMEEQRAAEIKKRALALEAEGERDAAIKKAQGTQTSLQIIADALRTHPESKEILRYLVAQDYVDASHKLSESNNAKIVFLDPSKGQDIYEQLIADAVSKEGNGKTG